MRSYAKGLWKVIVYDERCKIVAVIIAVENEAFGGKVEVRKP